MGLLPLLGKFLLNLGGNLGRDLVLPQPQKRDEGPEEVEYLPAWVHHLAHWNWQIQWLKGNPVVSLREKKGAQGLDKKTNTFTQTNKKKNNQLTGSNDLPSEKVTTGMLVWN